MAKITHIIPGLTNGVTYYGKVFSVNPKKRANGRADLTVFAAVPSEFPAEPTAYTLIAKYTSSQTWVAPEDGWFKIEVHGASGTGGYSSSDYEYEYSDDPDEHVEKYWGQTGGSGGGSGYAASIVKLKAGDIVVLSPGAVGVVSSATVTSSYNTEYSHSLQVTGAGNGTKPSGATKSATTGKGGSGGVASGGNSENINGSAGKNGAYSKYDYSNYTCSGPAGGAPGHVDGNTGGAGGGFKGLTASSIAPGSGKAGFIKISRGNTNL